MLDLSILDLMVEDDEVSIYLTTSISDLRVLRSS
jgi:hypothetical protein